MLIISIRIRSLCGWFFFSSASMCWVLLRRVTARKEGKIRWERWEDIFSPSWLLIAKRCERGGNVFPTCCKKATDNVLLRLAFHPHNVFRSLTHHTNATGFLFSSAHNATIRGLMECRWTEQRKIKD